MATEWISGMVSNAVSGMIASGVAHAGEFTGGALSGVGNAINGFGSNVESSIRRYGDGAKNYGNAVKDWTKASGPRAGTAMNPLGLSRSSTAGKLTALGTTSPLAPRQISGSMTTPKGSTFAASAGTGPKAIEPAKPASTVTKGKVEFGSGGKSAALSAKRKTTGPALAAQTSSNDEVRPKPTQVKTTPAKPVSKPETKMSVASKPSTSTNQTARKPGKTVDAGKMTTNLSGAKPAASKRTTTVPGVNSGAARNPLGL